MLAVKLGMAGNDDFGKVGLAVAGFLMGTVQPERWLRHAFIQAVAYRGDRISISGMGDTNYQIDAKDIFGPLDVQVAEACRFVARNQKMGARKVLGRTGLSAVRHDGCVRSRRQRSCPSGLFDAGLKGQDAHVLEPPGAVLAGRVGQHYDARDAGLSPGDKKRGDYKPDGQVQGAGADPLAAIHSNHLDGPAGRRSAADP